MSIYKNDLDETVRFRIEPRIGTEGIYLELKENGKRATTVFPPKDAPALALAVLEAAGVAESSDAGVAAGYLRSHIAEQERTTAEAKEQAELEAEALELRNEFTGRTATEWAYPTTTAKEGWIAVARKAREMRAEK